MAESTRHCFLQITQHHALNAAVHQVMQEMFVNIGLNHVVATTMASRTPGTYKIFDDRMNLFDVFCHFDLNSTNTWTLVQSYQLQKIDSFRRLPFTLDFSINAKSPRWDAYRLSKFRMESIQEDSTKFRMTCNYDSDGVVYRDYLQVAKGQFNILTYKWGKSCILVEHINIRGQSCEECTLLIYHDESASMHTDSYYSTTESCHFKPTGGRSCRGLGEDNFGVYYCVNEAHRCSSSKSSTTQTWLGGH